MMSVVILDCSFLVTLNVFFEQSYYIVGTSHQYIFLPGRIYLLIVIFHFYFWTTTSFFENNFYSPWVAMDRRPRCGACDSRWCPTISSRTTSSHRSLGPCRWRTGLRAARIPPIRLWKDVAILPEAGRFTCNSRVSQTYSQIFISHRINIKRVTNIIINTDFSFYHNSYRHQLQLTSNLHVQLFIRNTIPYFHFIILNFLFQSLNHFQIICPFTIKLKLFLSPNYSYTI